MFKNRCPSAFHVCKNGLAKMPAQKFITDMVGVSWYSANRAEHLPIKSECIRGKIHDFISILFSYVSYNSDHAIVLRMLTSGLMEKM